MIKYNDVANAAKGEQMKVQMVIEGESGQVTGVITSALERGVLAGFETLEVTANGASPPRTMRRSRRRRPSRVRATQPFMVGQHVIMRYNHTNFPIPRHARGLVTGCRHGSRAGWVVDVDWEHGQPSWPTTLGSSLLALA